MYTGLQRFLLKKYPGVVGLGVLLMGAMIIGSDIEDVRKFHAFENSMEIKGKVVAVRGAGTGSNVDISVAWFEPGKNTKSAVTETPKKRAGTRSKSKESVVEAPEVSILHRVPKARVVAQRNGIPLPIEAAALQEGDLIDILVSKKDESVILASERPHRPELKFAGLEGSSLAVFGLAFLVFGAPIVLARKRLSAEL